MTTAEYLRVDWVALEAMGRSGNAEHVPDAIEQLRTATTEEDALEAFGRIDNRVVVQGYLYESAEPTIPCVLAALFQCTDAARPWILDLLYDLSAATSGYDVEFINSGDCELERRCRQAVKLGVSHYFHLLEHGTPEESGACADLIGWFAEDDPNIAKRARWWLEHLAETTPNSDLRKACLDNLKDIPHPS